MCGTAVGSVGMTVSRRCVVGMAVGSGSMDVRKPRVGGVSVRSNGWKWRWGTPNYR